ncbi:hypothetical protein [Mesorhizobium sp. M00.F.Ca.ET.216.01.1.1]|uniref:hypothetical protein n=1 Tax=Mesorhizobium sp. M00.F.Ca.ET.216.01.1.1 TaxID=2500528 RepID=UPI000FDC8D80|nr:hypothetical protein [Mesorhizobium sp. M00.F.Ca.ET.216.01.1.1]TGQ41184.1 hypothetical protein EN859_012590 [Mesorhizobium sp. M00.F.Ca.ET.216.01.1.1]
MSKLVQVSNHAEPQERFSTVDDLATRWHCSSKTILANRKRWGLKMFRFGKTLLASEAAVREAEERRQNLIATG